MQAYRDSLFLRWVRFIHAAEEHPTLGRLAIKWTVSVVVFALVAGLMIFVIWFEVTDQRHRP